MILKAAHFQASAERNIHIFRDDSDSEHVEEEISTIARQIGHRLALLRGDRLTTEAEVLRELSSSLGFPKEGNGPNYEHMSWNGALDYLRGMRWPPSSPVQGESPKGHIILYSNPSCLIDADALQFATLLDVLGTGARFDEGGRVPIHVVIGPMSFRHEYFADLLSVSRNFCEECQCDGGENH